MLWYRRDNHRYMIHLMEVGEDDVQYLSIHSWNASNKWCNIKIIFISSDDQPNFRIFRQQNVHGGQNVIQEFILLPGLGRGVKRYNNQFPYCCISYIIRSQQSPTYFKIVGYHHIQLL